MKSIKHLYSIISVLLALTLGQVGCTKKEEVAKAPLYTGSAERVARGKAVYMANCIACHSTDPKSAGALGPDVAGSSRELLEARILRAEYPAGYTPKRSTKVMVAIPTLKDEIDALFAFLNQN